MPRCVLVLGILRSLAEGCGVLVAFAASRVVVDDLVIASIIRSSSR